MDIQGLINAVPDTLRKFEQISHKAKFFAFIATFLAPLFDFLVILVLFLFLDMVTSIWKQIKIKQNRCRAKNIKTKEYRGYALKSAWRVINPEKLPKTIEKIFGYSIALIICFIVDFYVLRLTMTADGTLYVISITNIVYGIILITEAISILRNLGAITNNVIFNQIIKVLVKKTNTGEYINYEKQNYNKSN